MRLHLAVILGACAVTGAFATTPSPAALRTGFIPSPHSRGAQTAFVSSGPGVSLQLTATEAALYPDQATVAPFRMRWLDANPRPEMHGENQLPGAVSFFAGRDPAQWRTAVPRFGQVRYAAVYRGIDLVFHHRNGLLEYDWLVEPGADPGRIRFEFPGVTRLRLDPASGALIATGADGAEMRHRAPRILQNGAEIPGGYVLQAGNRVSFRVGRYDRRRALLIDPVVTYSTLLGGSGNDGAFALAVDAAGSAYVAGITPFPGFTRPPATTAFLPAGTGAATPGQTNAFLAKLNPAGTALEYLVYLGGSANEVALGVAVDAAGNAYLTGGTQSPDFPTTPGALQRTYGGTGGNSLPPLFQPAGDAFVAKINAAGNQLIYSTYLGGADKDQAYGIAVDAAGNAWVAGTTGGPRPGGAGNAFPVTSGAFQTQAKGSDEGFIAKLNPAGSALVYSSLLGGSEDDLLFGLAVDATGSAYVAGLTVSTDFPATPNAYQPRNRSRIAAFAAKLDPTGSTLNYATYLGGEGTTQAHAIAADAAGNAYITGVTNSPDFPITAGAFAPGRTPGAQGDVFAIKLNPSGTAAVYSSVFGGSGTDYGAAIAVDPAGNAHIAGRTFSFGSSYTSLPTTANAVQRCGSDDGFLAKLDPAGASLLYSSHVGGSARSAVTAIAARPDGSVWLAGSTVSRTFPRTAGAIQSTYEGDGPGAFDSDSLMPYGGDAFVVKLDLSAPSRFELGCVLNAASLSSQAVSPGLLVSLFGGAMGPQMGAGAVLEGGLVQSAVAGVRVLFDGVPAPLLFVRADQINAVVPFGIRGDTAQVQVEYRGERSNAVAVRVTAATPGVFTLNSSGSGPGVILNQDGTLNSQSNPAAGGSVATMYVTGLGQTDPDGVDGSVNAAPLPTLRLGINVDLLFGPAMVLYAGPAPGLVAGVSQINFRLPAVPGPASGPRETQLIVRAGNSVSQAVSMWVR